MRGKFITFEGGEGTGKSTQAGLLAHKLESLGLGVLLTREPGGSPGAEIIRHVLLSGAAKPLGADAEAMLFAAAREDHVRCTIEPALAAGKWVVCDRFADSTRVYQGALGQVDRRLIKGLERVSIGDLLPDLTLILDVPVDVALERRALRSGRRGISPKVARGVPIAGRRRAGALRHHRCQRAAGAGRQGYLGRRAGQARSGHRAARVARAGARKPGVVKRAS